LRLGTEETDYFLRNAKRDNNLDVSDIDGAKPRIGPRFKSEKQLSRLHSLNNEEVKDELDNLANSGLHRRDLSMKNLGYGQEDKYRQREPSCNNLAAGLDKRKN
jgi:hypothetical protein